MAINVDKVYRVVLAIMNKEQRGYLTPDQFNRLGRQAQLDLLEKSFYDYNRALTRRNAQGVNSEYGDIAEKIEEKIEALTTSNWLDFGHTDPVKGVAQANEAWLTSNSSGDFDPIYKILSVSTNGTTGQGRTTQVERMKKSEFLYLNASKLTAPTQQFPAYFIEDSKLTIFPSGINEATIDYVKQPADPKWGYTIGTNNSYVYDYRTITDAQDQEIYTQQFVATESQTDFTITLTQLLDLPQNKITIRVNNTVVTNYTITNNVVTFDSGLTENDAVLVQTSLYETYMGSTDFELHVSEESNLVIKILSFAGIIIKDPTVVQAAQAQEVNEFNQQNA